METAYVTSKGQLVIPAALRKRHGIKAGTKIRFVERDGEIVIRPADQALAELAGEIKATKKMSLADCFAAALARDLKAELYTGDPEFHEVEKDVKIVWLR